MDEDLDSLTNFLDGLDLSSNEEEEEVEEEEVENILDTLLDDMKKESTTEKEKKRKSIDDLIEETNLLHNENIPGRIINETKRCDTQHKRKNNDVDNLLLETEIDDEKETYDSNMKSEDVTLSTIVSGQTKEIEETGSKFFSSSPSSSLSSSRQQQQHPQISEKSAKEENGPKILPLFSRNVKPKTKPSLLQGVLFGCMSPVRTTQSVPVERKSTSILSRFRGLFYSSSKQNESAELTSQEKKRGDNVKTSSSTSSSSPELAWSPLFRLFETTSIPSSQNIILTIEHINTSKRHSLSTSSSSSSSETVQHVISKLLEPLLLSKLHNVDPRITSVKELAAQISEPCLPSRFIALKQILKLYPNHHSPSTSLNLLISVLSTTIETGHGIGNKAMNALEQFQDLLFSDNFRFTDAMQILNGHSKKFILAVKCSSLDIPEIEVLCERSNVSLPSMTMHTSPLWIKPFFESTFGTKTKTRSDGTVVTVEEGEGHGPRKEFFLLLGEYFRGKKNKLFIYHQGSEAYWFNTMQVRSNALEKQYELVGHFLFASLANRCTIATRFCENLIEALICRNVEDLKTPTQNDLKLFDQDMFKSCQNVLSLSQKEYVAMLEMEDLPSDLPKSQYVDRVAKRVLRDDVKWQIHALRRGFYDTLQRNDEKTEDFWYSLMWRTSEIIEMFCSGSICTSEFSFRKTFRVVEDDEMKSCEELRKSFWNVVDSFDEDALRKFLKFSTGSNCIPEAGSEIFTIEMPFMAFGIDEHEKILLTLPRAHHMYEHVGTTKLLRVSM